RPDCGVVLRGGGAGCASAPLSHRWPRQWARPTEPGDDPGRTCPGTAVARLGYTATRLIFSFASSTSPASLPLGRPSVVWFQLIAEPFMPRRPANSKRDALITSRALSNTGCAFLTIASTSNFQPGLP